MHDKHLVCAAVRMIGALAAAHLTGEHDNDPCETERVRDDEIGDCLDRPLILICHDKELSIATELINRKKKSKISTSENWSVTISGLNNWEPVLIQATD